ncbi:MAG: hypothetical protein HOL08_11045 [Opitutae bacterium]|nr:hypothetical protein [Opitutae bacterium]MBT5379578.1 hypothetical protein [Opitutae bacterium]
MMIDVDRIRAIFTEEISGRSGNVMDEAEHQGRIFMRGVIPRTGDVRPDDKVQAGVALKATPTSISLYPYVFRHVCHNGLIFAHSTESRKLFVEADSIFIEVDGNLEGVISGTGIEKPLREAVEDCCTAEAFKASTHKFRQCLMMSPLRLHQGNPLTRILYGSVNKLGTYHKLAKAYLSPIMEEYLAHNDEPGMFRMVNAVTAVAREVRNPALKWNLECMAGEMAMLRNMPMIEPKPYRADLPNEKAREPVTSQIAVLS